MIKNVGIKIRPILGVNCLVDIQSPLLDCKLGKIYTTDINYRIIRDDVEFMFQKLNNYFSFVEIRANDTRLYFFLFSKPIDSYIHINCTLSDLQYNGIFYFDREATFKNYYWVFDTNLKNYKDLCKKFTGRLIIS